MERQGEFYDAVRCYRRAMQLVPDIEHRVNSSSNANNDKSSNTSSANESPYDSDDDQDASIHSLAPCTNLEDEDGPLIKRFLKIIESSGWKFFEKKKPDSKIHLNDLPVEVLTYIMR